MNIHKIKETELVSANFPECVCIYQYSANNFSMVEVNTGRHKGSIKVISNRYNSYKELKTLFNKSNTIYPVLFNYIIYNDILGCL
jgi:hypothetical protein